MTYIKRAIENTFLQYSREFGVVLLTGARQCGKTTMLRHLASLEDTPRTYVSLDDLNLRNMAKNDPKGFLQIYPPPVLIDEVQYAPELFPYIKIHVDEHQTSGDFWLTGSQIFKMMDGVQESLAGRVGLLQMTPLSHSEILGVVSTPFILDFPSLIARCKNIPAITLPEIYETIFRGGMPAMAAGKHESTNSIYSGYISTYIERDIRGLSGNIDVLKFYNFITAAASMIGQVLNFKTLADAADISIPVAKDWLNILEKLGLIFYLPPYSNNFLKRSISKPKMYFYDCGLVAHLTMWGSSTTLMNGALNCSILENFVISEIVKSYLNAGLRPRIYYYRDKDAKEIDVVLEADGTLYPMEIKKTATPDKRLISVFNVLDKSGMQRGKGAVICSTDRLATFDSDNFIIPVSCI